MVVLVLLLFAGGFFRSFRSRLALAAAAATGFLGGAGLVLERLLTAGRAGTPLAFLALGGGGGGGGGGLAFPRCAKGAFRGVGLTSRRFTRGGALFRALGGGRFGILPRGSTKSAKGGASPQPGPAHPLSRNAQAARGHGPLT